MAFHEEKRQGTRKPFTVTFDYTYSSVEEERLRCKNGIGISTNLSDNGMGFLTSLPMAAGQDIKVFTNKLSDDPISAEIRWCAKISDSLYKVGACFN